MVINANNSIHLRWLLYLVEIVGVAVVLVGSCPRWNLSKWQLSGGVCPGGSCRGGVSR